MQRMSFDEEKNTAGDSNCLLDHNQYQKKKKKREREQTSHRDAMHLLNPRLCSARSCIACLGSDVALERGRQWLPFYKSALICLRFNIAVRTVYG